MLVPAADPGPPAWASCSLESVAERVTVGHVGPMAHEYVAAGIPFLRSQDVAPLRIRSGDLKYIPPEFHRRLSKSALAPGDVVIVRTGRPGTAAVVPSDLLIANCADLVIVRPGPELDAHFLAYYLNTAATGYVSAHLVGAVQQHFNVTSARALTLRLPPLDEQRRIAAVLGALDEKIDGNRRLAKTLTDVIREEFRHQCVELRHLESTIVDLAAVARFINGRAFTKHATGSGRPIVRIRELNDGGVSHATPRGEIDAEDNNIAGHHDLLFSWSGSLDVYRWHGPESLINQHIFKVLPNNGIPIWFVEGWIREHLPEFRAIAKDKATTMGHIKREHLRSAEVRLPPPARLRELDAVLSPLDSHVGALAAETRTLTEVRDALLPKLVSGQIRVPTEDADSVTLVA